MSERESADWALTPMAAMEYYRSLTFMEQTALAYVVEQHRIMVQKQFEQHLEQVRTRYEVKP